MMPETVSITEMDYFRISSLIENTNSIFTDFVALEEEIERARIVDHPEVPPDLITMNTKFRYLNATDNRTSEITIVYPKNAKIEENRISVAAPLGTALLGLREGDEIDWTFPSGLTKRLKILEIIYQPEASGDLHL